MGIGAASAELIALLWIYLFWETSEKIKNKMQQQ